MIDIVKYAALPAVTLAVGHWIAVRPRSLRLTTIIDFQYFAAGIVFSAVSAELLPQIFARHNPLWVIVGFLAGTSVAHVTSIAVENSESLERGLLTRVLILNSCMVGLLIGAAFVAGGGQGRLLCVALCGRTAFVGLNTPYSAGLGISRTLKAGIATSVIGAMLIATAVLNYSALHQLPHAVFDGMLALALAGVLYLTTCDLFLEIQDELRASNRTRLFCMGFILFLALHMVSVGPAGLEGVP